MGSATAEEGSALFDFRTVAMTTSNRLDSADVGPRPRRSRAMFLADEPGEEAAEAANAAHFGYLEVSLPAEQTNGNGPSSFFGYFTDAP